jgi:hypothetical protein
LLPSDGHWDIGDAHAARRRIENAVKMICFIDDIFIMMYFGCSKAGSGRL